MTAQIPSATFVVSRQEALSQGLTPNQVRQHVRSGRWAALDTGVYQTNISKTFDDEHSAARAAHSRRAIAAVKRHEGCTIGFGSAAIIHGLTLTTGIPSRVQVIVPEGGWTGLRNGARYRAATLPSVDTIDLGFPITSVARTTIDVARFHQRSDAISVGDAALRKGVSLTDLRSTLARMGTVRGCRIAAAAIEHLDGRRETALESLSWARFLEWAIPLPVMQLDFHDDDVFIGRGDFWWPDSRVVGEADGRLKYQSADDVYAEKAREDRLRALGFRVIRWGWSDLWGKPADQLRRKIARAIY